MAGIRVNTGVKRIEVNDNGDYITLSLNDNDFLDRFFGLYENIQRMADDYTGKESAIREKYKGAEEAGRDSILKETFSLYAQAGKDMKQEVDGLFGEGTCKKVFGDTTPTFDLYLDFFEQLAPFLQEFAREKTQRMSKYSAARTGNV